MKIELTDKSFTGQPWLPFTHQSEIVQAVVEGKKHFCIVLARQHGKTEILSMLLRDFVLTFDEHPEPVCHVFMQTHTKAYETYFKRVYEKFISKLPAKLHSVKGSPGKETIELRLFRPHIGDWATIYFCGAGVRGAARGGTSDFVICDEVAFFPEEMLTSVIAPMVDFRNGYLFVTSTPNGPNHFYDYYQALKEEAKLPDSNCFTLHRTLSELEEVHGKKWAERIERMYRRGNKMDEFNREYNCDFFAGKVRELPFSQTLNEDCRVLKDPMYSKSDLYVVVDIGAYGNMATWFCVPFGHSVLCVDYEDRFNSNLHQIDWVWEKFKDYNNITFIYPHDVNKSSQLDEGTVLEGIQKYIARKGLGRRMSIAPPVRVADKLLAWTDTINHTKVVDFLATEGCDRGRLLLSKFRFKKDAKSGEVLDGKPVQNASVHCADAFLYLIKAWQRGIIRSNLIPYERNTIRSYRLGGKLNGFQRTKRKG